MVRSLSLALLSTPAVSSALDVDLSDFANGFRIDGASSSHLSGRGVSGAGDVNGDGLADLIVGATGAGPLFSVGASYVVFGKSDSSTVDLANLGAKGFELSGVDQLDRTGHSVSGAGDVNGDGLADLIIGAYLSNAGGLVDAGRAYVVFGKADGVTVDLANLGSRGFRINGATALDCSGRSVSGAGDVNGDGLADVIIGGPRADPAGNDGAGSSYVVFGKNNTADVDLNDLGAQGFRIDGIDSGDSSGFSVSGAGDFNGDGLADVLIGAYAADPDGKDRAGSSFVVFGKTDVNPVDLDDLGLQGIRLDGVVADDQLGYSVAGAGDVNGDGLADIIVGARGADPAGNSLAGASYVLFGHQADGIRIDLDDLGNYGFRVDGHHAGDVAGASVAGAGDLNGDGLADLLVGAPGADANSGDNAGISYAIFGTPQTTPVLLSNLSIFAGIRLSGAAGEDHSGDRVSSAGDVNGDGLADLIVGARTSDPYGRSNAGSSYVVFSQGLPPTEATYVGLPRGGNPPRMAIGVTGDGSNASHPASRAWIDFDQVLSIFSQVDVTLIRSAGAFPNPGAIVSWELSAIGPGLNDAEVKFRYVDSELQTNDESLLQLYHSSDGNAPFTPLPSVVNALDNTVTANVDELGFFFLGIDDVVFMDGFE